MNSEQLRQLDLDALADYLWRRLRLEPPVDPPISDRFGPEPPEQFLIATFEQTQDTEFRQRLFEAIKRNLARIAAAVAADPDRGWDDPVTDQQIASLAFLADELEGYELVDALYAFACCWIVNGGETRAEFTAGQFHVLRALADLQRGSSLARMWEDLWDRGPRSVRGLTIFGWARANADAALAKLGELVDMGDEIDLPTTVWSLVDQDAPGPTALGRAASKLRTDQRDQTRQALVSAGADASVLRDYDLKANPPVGANGGFRFAPETTPRNETASRVAPRWVPPLRPAA